MKFIVEASTLLFVAGVSGAVLWREARTVPVLKTLPIQWQTYQVAASVEKPDPIVDPAPEAVSQAARASVVGVFPASIRDRAHQAKFASGVVVNVDENSVDIVTNRHVVESLIAFDGTQGVGYTGQAAIYSEATGTPAVYDAAVLCVSDQPEVDIAILRIPGQPDLQPIQLPATFAAPPIDTPVWIAGSAGGVYGNLRQTTIGKANEPSIEVQNPFNSASIRYDATKLVWFTPRPNAAPAAEPGSSGGAILDGNGILQGFVFSTNQQTGWGAAISLSETLNWLENPSCNQQLKTEETPGSTQPQPEALGKLPVRPIGQRAPGKGKDPDGRDNPAAMPYVEQVYKAVVCVSPEFAPGCASGTSIDPALAGIDPSQGAVVLSNAHVTVGQPRVETPDGTPLEAQLIRESRQLDLSLVFLPGQQLPIAPLAPPDYEPEPGTPAWAIGFPVTANRKLVISPDSVVLGMMETCLATPPCIAIEDGTITNGNSGGALVADGMLIGVTEGETIEELAIPPVHIHTFLEEVKAGGGTNPDERGSGRGADRMRQMPQRGDRPPPMLMPGQGRGDRLW